MEIGSDLQCRSNVQNHGLTKPHHSSKMSKILIMTDPHITLEANRLAGLDSYERFGLGLAHAAAHHPDADHLVVMGDLTHYGTDEEYERVHMILQGLPWPVTLMMGNHDKREIFKKHFPDHDTDEHGYVQNIVDLDDVRLITLDSLEENAHVKHAGLLCNHRLAFLKDALSTSRNPCLVFIHHPPFETGFAGMDAISLLNAADVRAVLKGSVATHVFAGHIHRTITASVDGLSITTFKSTCHQMPMLLGHEGSAHSVDEPGAYGIALTRGSDVVVHFDDFTLPIQQVVQESASG